MLEKKRAIKLLNRVEDALYSRWSPKMRQVQGGGQSKTKLLYELFTLQNGGNAGGERLATEAGLAHLDRSEECLSSCAHLQ